MKYKERVKGIAAAIAKIDPDVLALQEIENKKVVKDLAKQLLDAHGKKYNVAFVQGGDSFTHQDVAFLVRNDLPVNATRFQFSAAPGFKNLSKHLSLKTTLGGEPVTIVTLHLIRNGAARKKQAKTLRKWTKAAVESSNVIVLGDFNSQISPTTTSATTDLGIVRGLDTATSKDDLSDVFSKIPPDKRKTHVGGSALDRVLLSPSLMDNTGLRFKFVTIRGDLAVRGSPDQGGGVDYDKPPSERDLSDHFPIVLTLKF